MIFYDFLLDIRRYISIIIKNKQLNINLGVTKKMSNKRITVDFPEEMYESFMKSSFRRKATTDSEGIRAAINAAIKSEDDLTENIYDENQKTSFNGVHGR